MKYLAYDGINGEYQECNTLQEAHDIIKERILEPSEGYHPDLDSCKVYELEETVSYSVVADKKDFTEEEWKDEGYNSDFEQIWNHHFNKVK